MKINFSSKLVVIKKHFSKTWLLIPAIFLLGVFFRLYHSGYYSIGFDQVQILEKAQQILQGDYTLVGPRTGPAQMFTGPLIYYVAAIFSWVASEVVAVYAVPTFFAAVTGLILYFLVRKYLDDKLAIYALLIWATSPYLINLDRVFWNPNLTLLAASLIFFPLLKKKLNWTEIGLISIGSFLSYQAHFSGFALVALALVTAIAWNRSGKAVLSLVGGLGLSLAPTFLFDLRNQWLNFQGLLALVEEKGDLNLLSTIGDVSHNLYVILETFGKIFLFGNSTQTIVLLGIILMLGTLKWLRFEPIIKLCLAWLLTTGIAFSFYHGPKPEYYFLFCLPALLVIILKLLALTKPNLQQLLIVIVVANSIYVNYNLLNRNSGMSLINIIRIKDQLSVQPVKEIIYDVEYGSAYGLKYFLRNFNFQPAGRTMHLNYPAATKYDFVQKVSDIALWADPRTGDKNYLSTDRYFLETNPQYFAYVDQYPRFVIQPYNQYKILLNNSLVATVAVAHESRDQLDWVRFCVEENRQGHGPGWIQFSSHELVKLFPSDCAKIYLDNLTVSEIENLGLRIF